MAKKKLVVFTACSLVVCLAMLFSMAFEAVGTAFAANYTQEDLYEEGYALNTELEEEGAVLMYNKNSALPLGTGVTVDTYGYCSYNIIHGGGGSGKGKWDSQCLQIKEAFELAGLDVNDELWKWFGKKDGGNITQESWVLESNGGELVNGNTYNLPELSVEKYKKSASVADPENNVAIVTVGRQGHEGAELPMDMSSNYVDSDLLTKGEASRTYLDPTSTELALLKYLKEEEHYSKIILLINSSNVMTIGEYLEYVDACLWIGGPGENGLVGVAEVLMGYNQDGYQISPSGRTADTWMTDFYSYPVFYNNGSGCSFTDVNRYVYNEYEEGIYVGYRWYETAYADKLKVSGTNGEEFDFYNDYDEIVAMPFGGGLSYTSFDYEVVSSDIQLKAHGTNTISVKVTNTGDWAGKDVVQIYVHAPYNAGGIEKSEVVLVGYAKTGRLQPGQYGTVTITFQTDDFASYDFMGYKAVANGKDYNGNDKWGGYVLEAGDYEFRIQSDAHTQKTEPITANLASDILYTESGIGARESDETVAYNKINDVNAGSGNSIWMKRSTFEADWTTITNNGTGRQDQVDKVAIGSSLSTAINTGKAVSGVPQTNTVTLEVPYQSTTKTITLTYGYQGSTEFVGNTNNYWGKSNSDKLYQDAIANIGKSATTYTENTRFKRNGTTISATDAVVTDTNDATSYGWDEVPWDDIRWDNWVDQGSLEDMVKLQGTSYDGAYTSWGIERNSCSDGPGEAGTGGKTGNTWWCSEVVMASTWNPELIERVGAAYGRQCVRTNITSCFGPAMDTHRSPFGGRNFEYFSEDGLLAGTMCVAETAGIQSEGVGTYNKHFMLNDLDGGRSGQIDFCNEQALREIYIRAWEYSMKSDVAPMSGMMASLNRIGITWANRGVYVGIVREEYGWHGLAISDGMDGVDYSGAVKAAYSQIACLLWSSTVNGSEADNDGYMFTGKTTSETGIADYYGVYQLRETAKNRLWYDTHIYCKSTVFTTDYYVAGPAPSVEEDPVITINPNVSMIETTESGCASVLTAAAAAFVVPVIALAALVIKKKD